MTTVAKLETETKTSVWWDIENCEVPKGWDAHAIAQNVSSALWNMNYSGPVSIYAYGDTNLIPLSVQQALSSTGVGLNHVPAGLKDASDKKILVDMLFWAVDNPAPANFMLISGDRDFSNALHQLRLRRYTILLAQPSQASVPLVAAAKNVWLWTTLASGGPPLTSGESSQLVNKEHCHDMLKHPVSEQGQPNKPTDSNSETKTRQNHVPRGLPQETRRNMLQNGKGATGESVRICNAKPKQEAEFVEPIWCKVCLISLASKDTYANHTYGKRHRNNLELQSCKSEIMSGKTVEPLKEVVEKQKNKKPKGKQICRLCNVACSSQIDFDSHLRGQKHANMLSHSKTQIGSKKVQEKGVGEKDQPRETIAEPQSQNSQDHTKLFENKNEALKDSSGTSESNDLRCDFEVSREARECLDGIDKPVNQSKGETEHSWEVKKEVMVRHAGAAVSKLCNLCVVICDSQGLSTMVCRNQAHWTNQIKPKLSSGSGGRMDEKLEDDSKHKPKPKSKEPENECGGRKKDPGESAKKEEIKGQVDNFWTSLWGKKC